MFYFPEHARRANFLCSRFCSPSKYFLAEHARRAACSELCSEILGEHARRVTSRIVVQKHPLFITQGDEAFKLRCTYPAGEISLMSHYNISMLSTSDTLLRDGAVPQCNLAVASTSSGQTVDEATVGELLQLKLSVSPRDTFALIARNCVALNMETGERYQLTDTDGCAVDPVVFPEWRQETPSDLYANFLTFKWPDTAQIRFQCDCSPCVHRCEPVDCNGEKSYGRRKKRQIDHWASANQVYSSVLIVKNLDSVLDDEASALEDGLTNDANQTDHQISIDNTDVCLNTGVLAAALALAICLVTTMTGGLVLTCYRRKSAVEKILRRIPVAECDFFDTTTSKLGHGYHSSSTLCDTRTSEYSAGSDPLRNNDDLKVL
uniref:ZP domain-containing protein n=1 Tax=Romanomermis culicivorax TaxID=13658 RepID=A0A915K979_ROMCU